ncbi:AraC family transcriptional regulator, partial [Streptomyces sp. SID2131]|nr:AraC family transcriptional regulator [Streptomyces sp. SID2131]
PVVPAQVAAGVRRPVPPEPGKPHSDAYAPGRPSLPGQRSAP